MTGDPKGLDKVIESIRFFQSIRVPVGLNYTMIRQNAEDYPKVGELCRELNLSYTLITDITAHHFDRSFSDALSCRLTPAERACIACHSPEDVGPAMEEAKKLERELEHFQLPEAPGNAASNVPDACIGSSSGCAICWNGDMQTCISLSRYNCVKPFEIGFEAAWAQLKAKQNQTFLRPAASQVCEMASDCLHNCTGRRFEGTGLPLRPDPYTCQYVYLLRLCRARHADADLPPVPNCP